MWLSVKKLSCQCRRHRSIPGLEKSPCRRKWQSIPVFLPGKFHEQRRPGRLVVCSPWGRKELDMTEHAHIQFWQYLLKRSCFIHCIVLVFVKDQLTIHM